MDSCAASTWLAMTTGMARSNSILAKIHMLGLLGALNTHQLTRDRSRNFIAACAFVSCVVVRRHNEIPGAIRRKITCRGGRRRWRGRESNIRNQRIGTARRTRPVGAIPGQIAIGVRRSVPQLRNLPAHLSLTLDNPY